MTGEVSSNTVDHAAAADTQTPSLAPAAPTGSRVPPRVNLFGLDRAALREQFEKMGEAGFRALESAVLEDLAGTDRAVIATGGGIITVPDNIPRLRDLGLVIWLNPPEEILFQRIMRNHDRPLVRTGNPRQTVHDLLTLRRPLYTSAAHLDVDVSDVTPDEAAYGLAESVRVHFAQPLA